MFIRNTQKVLSGLLLGMALPLFAAQATKDCGLDIYFSDTYEAKRIVQSAYTTLVEMNGTLQHLEKYTAHSLSSGNFYDDELFQKKKNNLPKVLNNHKINFSLFRQAIYIYQRGERGAFFHIPAMTFGDLNLHDTDLLSVEHAKNAEKALLNANQTLLARLSPINVIAHNNKPSASDLDTINTLGISDPKAFTAISNNLEQIYQGYNKRFIKLIGLTSKAAKSQLSSGEREALNITYRGLLAEMEYHFHHTSINTLPRLFKDNELTLRLGNGVEKTWYFPDLSLSTLQLKDDYIANATAAVKTYIDLEVAMDWIVDWTINGQQVFIPANERQDSPILPSWLTKNT